MNKLSLCILTCVSFLLFACGDISAHLFGGRVLESPSLSSGETMEAKGFPYYGVTKIQDKTGAALGSSGEYYVFGAFKVQKFNSSGLMIQEFSTPANDYRFIATDSNGNLYIYGLTQAELYKYSAAGTSLGTIPLTGISFNAIEKIKFDSAGNIYLATYTTDSVVLKFNSSGVFQGQIGVDGATDIAFDSSGNMYLPYGDHLKKLDSSGALLTTIGSLVEFPTFEARSVEVGTDGTIFVRRTGSYCDFSIFNNAGNFVNTVTLAPEDNRRCDSFFTLKDGKIYISANYQLGSPEWNAGGRGHVYEFSTAGTLLRQLPETYAKNYDELANVKAIALARNGDVYLIVDVRLMKFDRTGQLLYEVTQVNGSPFISLGAVTTNANGQVYVADAGGAAVYIFNSDGTYHSKLGSPGQFTGLTGVAVDSKGQIYVLDGIANKIQKFSAEGNWLSEFGGAGAGQGQFNNPFGIAVDSSDTIYIVDTMNARIQKLDSTGKFLGEFGSSGAGNGQFSVPFGAFVDSRKHVFVTDYVANRIQEFDSDGNYKSQFSGTLTNPLGIFGDSFGNLYVTDLGNKRVQKFKDGIAVSD